MGNRPGPTLWNRTRWTRFAFVAGVAVGIVVGWFSHQVVSFLMGAGIVFLALVPFALGGYLWWRSRSRGVGERPRTVVAWSYDTATGASRIDGVAADEPSAAARRSPCAKADLPNQERDHRHRRSIDPGRWSDND